MASAKSTVRSVASSDSAAVTLLARRTGREAYVLWNATDKSLYVKLGADADTDDYSFSLGAGAGYESPPNVYTGIVTAKSASGAIGNVLVTELYG